MEKILFYSVLFYIEKDGQHYVVPQMGTREVLQKAFNEVQKDESVDSAVAVYLGTFSASDTSPIIVKKKQNKEDVK